MLLAVWALVMLRLEEPKVRARLAEQRLERAKAAQIRLARSEKPRLAKIEKPAPAKPTLPVLKKAEPEAPKPAPVKIEPAKKTPAPERKKPAKTEEKSVKTEPVAAEKKLEKEEQTKRPVKAVKSKVSVVSPKKTAVKEAAPKGEPKRVQVAKRTPVSIPKLTRPAPVVEKRKPRISIVLDDWGYSDKQFSYLSSIRRPLTLAVLPYHPYSYKVCELARRYRYQVILHLPLESHQADAAAEAETIRSGMSEEEVRGAVASALDSLPYLSGLNNHQGSKATEDEGVMRAILAELKSRRLFFLDSMTSSRSVGGAIASEMGLPYAKRDVFLDNTDDEASIRAQIGLLANDARARGWAIGIGHDRPATMRVLKEEIPRLEKSGIQLVYVSDLVQ